MNIKHHMKNTYLVYEIPSGDGPLVDSGNIEEFIQQITCTWDEGSANHVALDMSSKHYLNSSGLSDLIQVKDGLLDREIPLTLLGVQPKVQSLLTMVGMIEFFTLFDNEDQLV